MSLGSSSLPLGVYVRNRSRSMGIKLLLVCGLALLMMIPAYFVSNVVDERAQRAKEVTEEISGRAGGQQILLGPTLAIPYSVPSPYKNGSPALGTYVVFPTSGNSTFTVHTQERRRSLFRVPVYQAAVKFDAAFDLTHIPQQAPSGAVLEWSRAAIFIGLTDARGALGDGTLNVGGKSKTFSPADNIAGENPHIPLTYFSADVSEIAKPNGSFSASVDISLSGAQRIAILAYGKSTHLTANGDWPNPSFDGGFLPMKRAVSSQGFTGEWSIPYIARGVPAEGMSPVISALDHAALGVSFVEVVDPYQSVSRSMKYALLFIGLLFLSYFIFEVTARKRVHPAQYILVGIAHMVFYLLLLSLAERIGFDWGFFAAGIATVLLLAANAGWIFASRIQGLRALIAFGLLYFAIYLLLRLEDNALLVGAVASFLVVAAVMYFTRNMDWYGSVSGTTVDSSQPLDGTS